MKEIFNDFLSVINSSPEKYGEFYIDNVQKVQEFINTYDGVKTDVYLKNFTNDLGFIRFSSVFSDLTNVYPSGLGDGVKIHTIPNQTITISSEILNRFQFTLENKPVINAGYIVREKQEFYNFLSNIKPLIIDERVIVHNSRCILGLTKADDEKTRTWQYEEVSSSSPLTNWIVQKEEQKSDSIPIVFNSKDDSFKKEIIEITIPYLKNIPIKELAKVLNDYQDHLQKLRNEVKAIVRLAKDEEKNIDEAKNDLVRPRIEEIERVFKKIKRQHRLKSYGVYLGFVPLILTSIYSDDIANLATGLLGSGGIGLQVKNEVDYQKGLQDLEEKPLYLLWKINNVNL